MRIEIAFGIVLRRLRNERKLSQEELAEISGFHRTYISLLERGEKSPSLNTLHRFSDSLSISLKELISQVEKYYSDNCEGEK